MVRDPPRGFMKPEEYHRQTPEGGTPLASDHPVYLRDPVLDATVRMLVELAAQVWVDRERLLTIEALLDENGVVTREAIEKYHPDEARQAALKAERNRFVADVFKELRRIDPVV
jgi:hypothetical protein